MLLQTRSLFTSLKNLQTGFSPRKVLLRMKKKTKLLRLFIPPKSWRRKRDIRVAVCCRMTDRAGAFSLQQPEPVGPD